MLEFRPVGACEVVMASRTRRQAGRQADRQAGRQADRQAGRQAGRQTGRQAGRQATDQTTVLCFGMLWYAMLCYALLCFDMLGYATRHDGGPELRRECMHSRGARYFGFGQAERDRGARSMKAGVQDPTQITTLA
ncbi:flagellar assembly protein H [Venturia nashicola]|uniref:Flagellar assembly protein H n=1 Tax=Venturia nashicola TaxID=86259 RepID=A0A4Z1P019_9PEZI|nr:flagellar assembly protein H [Venturia nashicola]TLD25808.1 flagellar assembly protein H [Venturia nashicola]